jgi:hypothetical protein
MMSSCFEVGCGWFWDVECMLEKIVGVQVGFYMVKSECHDSLIKAVDSQQIERGCEWPVIPNIEFFQ